MSYGEENRLSDLGDECGGLRVATLYAARGAPLGGGAQPGRRVSQPLERGQPELDGVFLGMIRLVQCLAAATGGSA